MTELSQYTRATPLLDYGKHELQRVVQARVPRGAKPEEAVRALYAFVSSMPLGYNRNDNVSASHILRDGYGQCNTKTVLVCALARGAGIPTRIHAFALHKDVQKRRAPDWLVACMPKTTVFFWPEFFINKKWVPLQKLVFIESCPWDLCPFDGAKNQRSPLKKEWIAHDLGLWASPDEFFEKNKPSVHGWRAIGWHVLGRPLMNRRAWSK